MPRDQRTRAQPRSVTQPPIRDGSGRAEGKADRRRPRGEWNHRPPGAGRVILVIGTQKIVPDLEQGLRRIHEYAWRLEVARPQAAYGIHSALNKVVIINREITPGRITVVLVDEVLGF